MYTRLAAEVGLGTASLATASRLGNVYSSDVFSPGPWRKVFICCCPWPVPRSQTRADERAHRKMVSASLAFANLISYHFIPVAGEDGLGMELKAWPFILPDNMVGASLQPVASLQLNAFLCCKFQVKCLLQMGHRNLLGQAEKQYWELLRTHFNVSRPADAADCIPVSVFGDEVEVFDGLQYCCINWSSDVALQHTDAKVTRFFCCMVPTTSYHMNGKVNCTIQACMGVIVRSLNRAYSQGILGTHLVVTGFKGDWKWMCQILNSINGPSTNLICFRCKASKDLTAPLTDTSPEAVWRNSVLQDDEIWWERPAVADVHGFNMLMFCPDIMHTYHLGIGRDVASSVLLILLKRGLFPGSSAPCWCENLHIF